VPPTDLVVRLAAPLPPNTTLLVRVTDLRTLANVVGTSERTFTTPRAAPAAAPPAAPQTPGPAAAPTPAPAAPGTPPPARPATPTAPPPPARRP
jgi:hypothetical protein